MKRAAGAPASDLSSLTFIFPVVLSDMGRVFALITREAHGITSTFGADPTNAVSHPGEGEAAQDTQET